MNELYLKVLQYFLLDVNYNKKYVKTWYIKLFFPNLEKIFQNRTALSITPISGL